MSRRTVRLATTSVLVFSAGCATFSGTVLPAPELPGELEKVTHAEYIIERPDELLLDAIRVVPLPPYRISALDQLCIQSNRSLPDEPISGTYQVESEGVVKLGPNYGS